MYECVGLNGEMEDGKVKESYSLVKKGQSKASDYLKLGQGVVL